MSDLRKWALAFFLATICILASFGAAVLLQVLFSVFAPKWAVAVSITAFVFAGFVLCFKVILESKADE